MLTQRHRKPDSSSDIGFAELELLGHASAAGPPGAGSLGDNRSIRSGRTASTPTPRGPAIHLRDVEYVDVGTRRAVHLAQRLGCVHHQWHPQLAAEFRDHRQRLHHPAVAGHRGQVDQIGRLCLGERRVVERHPAVLERRQQLHARTRGRPAPPG